MPKPAKATETKDDIKKPDFTREDFLRLVKKAVVNGSPADSALRKPNP